MFTRDLGVFRHRNKRHETKAAVQGILARLRGSQLFTDLAGSSLRKGFYYCARLAISTHQLA